MYALACFAVPFQQFLKLPAVGGDEFLFQLTALDLDGNIIVVRADKGAAGAFPHQKSTSVEVFPHEVPELPVRSVAPPPMPS